MLIDTISKDIMLALKDKNRVKKSILVVIKGESERVDDKSDVNIVGIINKTLKTIIENYPILTPELEYEIEVLSSYLPQELSTTEINDLVVKLIANNGYSGMGDMRHIMDFFKENYPNKYQGGVVSTIAKDNLM